MMSARKWMQLLALCLGAVIRAKYVDCFQMASTLVARKEAHPLQSLQARRRRSLDDDEEEVKEPLGIPQLPSFGSSSFSTTSVDGFNREKPSQSPVGENPDAAFVTPKFKLQYTCNICDTRNSHMVSRLAYREGIVIAICKGCKNKHLIADNLNKVTGFEGGTNIEEYFKSRGMEESVIRVTPEVFDLENIMRFDTTSGALVGDDGNPVLE